ncbi:MAG: hypothetical protein KIT11_11305 [Fimbriimonadaceae bacterium]|nr:hypothetical protein [Fimbriimonadaceae bacterium]QYK55381.1 MAG: hypothetical protein KF733_10230 [Fimbriimonadaceae bacterium]
MIAVARPTDPSLLALLDRHPEVELVERATQPGQIDFWQGDWHRQVVTARPDLELYGVVEIEDNNPLVCADVASVPGPAATLATLALAPVGIARIVSEPPSLLFASPVDYSDLEAALPRCGIEGADLAFEQQDLGTVVAMLAMVVVEPPGTLEEVAALYRERYERSFFVRESRVDEWYGRLVEGQHHAAYRLESTEDEGHALLSVHVIADLHGKCGASQLVHCMNVMAGFEESLGLDRPF